jgi:hypothetical protein
MLGELFTLLCSKWINFFYSLLFMRYLFTYWVLDYCDTFFKHSSAVSTIPCKRQIGVKEQLV